MSPDLLDAAQVSAFRKDGVVLIKGLFSDWVEPLRNGIEHNMQSPGDYGKNYTADGQKGCLLYTSPSPRDGLLSRMPSSA